MDVWIIAAAAGAGYLAKRFKKPNMDNCNFSGSSSVNLEIAAKSPATVNRMVDNFAEEISRPRARSSINPSAEEMASTSGYEAENVINSGNLGAWDMASDSNSLTGPSHNQKIAEAQEGRLFSVMDGDLSGMSREIGFSYGFRRNRSSLRCRQVNSRCIKPQTSLESCLMAQLYKEQGEMEEYTYSACMPWEPTLRPFIVTDGSQIISRACHESCSKQIETGNYKLGKDNHTNCAPRLPNVVHLESQKRDKGKFVKKSVPVRGNPRKKVNKHQGNGQGSSPDVALLFYLGLAMGITYSSLQHKQDIEKLSNSLKQTEDLVQDLQEELELKDESTVKEIAVEDHESLDMRNYSYFNDPMQALSPEQKLDCSPRDYNGDCHERDSEEESLRRIEAELEAELDRLASNMKSSSLEGKLSNAAEQLGPDFMSDANQRDHGPELFGPKSRLYPGKGSTGGDSSTSTTATPHSAHYPISPRDLSLRLHQVIQARLEDRIRELETALDQSQRRIRGESNNSTWESPFPAADEILRPVDQPVVINLSGEALKAYNEAYDELAKLSEPDEVSSENYADQCLGSNGSSPKRVGPGFGVDGPNDALCDSGDGSEDEMEKLLIRQIVEKARQGSPAILKAGRDLLLSSNGKYGWE